jgi:hypothetical protein
LKTAIKFKLCNFTKFFKNDNPSFKQHIYQPSKCTKYKKGLQGKNVHRYLKGEGRNEEVIKKQQISETEVIRKRSERKSRIKGTETGGS